MTGFAALASEWKLVVPAAWWCRGCHTEEPGIFPVGLALKKQQF